MEIDSMGKVVARARIENIEDLYEVEKERLAPNQIRSIEVDNALVDTGATMLSLPTRLIKQLGVEVSSVAAG